jgi:hypothetical protein
LKRWRPSIAARYQELKISSDSVNDTLYFQGVLAEVVSFVRTIGTADREKAQMLALVTPCEFFDVNGYFNDRGGLLFTLRKDFPMVT